MDSETRLAATNEQAKELIERLRQAVNKSNETGELAYADITIEQMKSTGPWRLVIGVLPDVLPEAEE